MVRITLGKELDGALAVHPLSSVNELTCGPLRLLSWLESQLGLTLPEVSFTSRMVRYLECLKSIASDRFYEASLAQDEFATARTLLQWRDILYESGWAGDAFSAGVSGRLMDLAAVEAKAQASVPPNLGQRVQRVTEALAASPIDVELTVLDSAECFGKVWQNLFAVLATRFEPLAIRPKADLNSDLGRLQRALVGEHIPG